jgi:hypothetical protein
LTEEINTAVPLSLHPDVMQTLGEDFQTDPIVHVLRDALGTAHASWKATLAAHDKVMADPLSTPQRNMQRSAAAAAKRQQEALSRLDAAVERAQREVGFINDAVNQVPDAPPSYVVRMVADTLRELTPQKRSAVIAEALQVGDTSIIGPALFVGPPASYGLTRSERDMLRHQYQSSAYPAALARRTALEAGIEKLKQGGQALIAAHSKKFDQKMLDDAAARARQAEEALSQ